MKINLNEINKLNTNLLYCDIIYNIYMNSVINCINILHFDVSNMFIKLFEEIVNIKFSKLKLFIALLFYTIIIY